MSEQALSLDNWKKVHKAFREHFGSEKVKLEDNTVKYSSGREFLKIKKDGNASGSMPLHEVSLSETEEIIFRSSEVEVKSGENSYIFRR